jgi:hypothetical protein
MFKSNVPDTVVHIRLNLASTCLHLLFQVPLPEVEIYTLQIVLTRLDGNAGVDLCFRLSPFFGVYRHFV